MKKKLVVLILISFFFIPCVSAEDLAPNAKSTILIEESTGKILYEKNSDEKRAPASMTKVMSMLLIMEALDNKQISLNDEVTISQNAADMGGSQLFLQPNQTAKVEDLLKGIAVASGNDAVVAIAEKIAGSEEKFVDMMNKKAKKLGLKNTQFKNPHGLDEEGHYTSAHNMAIMAKELIKHKNILNYTSIYEEYLTKSDGTKLWMVNTNKLVKFYKGVDGLKTGFTQTAGYCLTATAMKNNTRLISVVMGEDTSANRSTDTVNLLNYGFNSYKVNTIIKKEKNIAKVKVNKGKEDKVYIRTKENVNELLNVNEKAKKYILVPEVKNITAPVKVGEKVGILKIKYQNKVVKEVDLTVSKNIKKANLCDLFKRNLKMIVSGK